MNMQTINQLMGDLQTLARQLYALRNDRKTTLNVLLIADEQYTHVTDYENDLVFF